MQHIIFCNPLLLLTNILYSGMSFIFFKINSVFEVISAIQMQAASNVGLAT